MIAQELLKREAAARGTTPEALTTEEIEKKAPEPSDADIQKVYKDWSSKGVKFLTEPKDHGVEIRAYIRDPDGHLIEVGQSRM